jgi:hypothetical protein
MPKHAPPALKAAADAEIARIMAQFKPLLDAEAEELRSNRKTLWTEGFMHPELNHLENLETVNTLLRFVQTCKSQAVPLNIFYAYSIREVALLAEQLLASSNVEFCLQHISKQLQKYPSTQLNLLICFGNALQALAEPFRNAKIMTQFLPFSPTANSTQPI